jgi:F-type H+-transporting ATPase subunit alpha
MRKVAGKLRLDLAQYRALATFAQFGTSDLDAATQKQLATGARLTELLKQPQYRPMSLPEQVISFYSVVNGHADDVPVDRIAAFEEQMLAYLRTSRPEVLQSITDKKDLDEQDTQVLEDAIGAFKLTFA